MLHQDTLLDAGAVAHGCSATEDLDFLQKAAHDEAIDAIDAGYHWVSISAGAGSGKTKTLTAIARTLVGNGMSASRIALLSFTRAASADLQRKTISAFVENGEKLDAQPSGATIHAFAADLIKKLAPHVPGLSLYVEDGAPEGRDEERLDAEHLRLALHATLYHADTEAEAALRIAFCDEIDKGHESVSSIAADIDDWRSLHVKAQTLIETDRMIHIGLGSFTDLSAGDPDRMLAVATEALLRWRNTTGGKSVDGLLPGVVLYDEAQDGDILHLLFLRALMVNGVAVIAVGDSNQELYEFRQAIGDLPFRQGFIEAFARSAGRLGKVGNTSLDFNYRSREPIITLGNDLSEKLVIASRERRRQCEEKGVAHKPNTEAINDPETRRPSLPRTDKTTRRPFGEGTSSIRVIQGAAVDRTLLTDVREQPKALVEMKVVNSPGGRLAAAAMLAAGTVKAEQKTVPEAEVKARRATSGVLVVLAGDKTGKDISAEFERGMFDLFRRACMGEGVALIARNNFNDDDRRLLRDVVLKRWLETPEGKEHEHAARMEFRLLGKRRTPALGAITMLSRDLGRSVGVPFSSVMVFAAVAWFLGLGTPARDRLATAGLKMVNSVPSASGMAVGEYLQRNGAELVRSIAVELTVLFDYLCDGDEVLDGVDPVELRQVAPVLRDACARYIALVLAEFAVLAGPGRRGGLKCRLNSIVRWTEMETPNIPVQPVTAALKRFWRAVCRAPFIADGEVFEGVAKAAERAGFASEYLPARVGLATLSREVVKKMAVERKAYEAGRAAGIKPEALEAEQEIKLDREFIHEAFVMRFRKMTGGYARSLARLRAQVQRNGETYASQQDLWNAFGADEWRARVANNMVFDLETLNGAPKGVAKLFLKPFHEITIEGGADDAKVESTPERPIIQMATIHASKGLEWDHVMFCLPTSPSRAHGDSMKTVRNLFYVAVTRARRTLTLALPKRPGGKAGTYTDKKNKEVTVVGAMRSSLLVLHDWLHTAHPEWFGAELDWEWRGEDGSADRTSSRHEVFRETSHTEIEVASRCGHEHDQRFRRGLSPLTLIASPNYGFVFHNTMASICAHLAGQRIAMPVDPIVDVADTLRDLLQSGLDEDGFAARLAERHGDDIEALMEVMQPMYLAGEDAKRDNALRRHYREAFLRHLAAVACGSGLFHTLVRAAETGGEVWIEKHKRHVFEREGDDGRTWHFPLLGIPDIRIRLPDLFYIVDHKTVPVPDADDEEARFMQFVSATATAQANLYQRMSDDDCDGRRRVSELILVANVTVPDHADVPPEVPVLPQAFQGHDIFKLRSKTRHARVVRAEGVSDALAVEMADAVQQLRRSLHPRHSLVLGGAMPPTPRVYENTPLIGDSDCATDEATCQTCSLAIHCARANHVTEV